MLLRLIALTFMTFALATSVASWSFAMLVAATALRRVLPAPVAAILLGGAVVAADSYLSDRGEARDAATAAKSAVAPESSDSADG